MGELAFNPLDPATRRDRVGDEPLPLHPSPVFRAAQSLPVRLEPA